MRLRTDKLAGRAGIKMAGPLAGIRVLDLGHFVACPFCGMLLADLGAEVIRVERSGGAEDRFYELPTPSGDGYTFVNVNRNKKGISLNFERNKLFLILLLGFWLEVVPSSCRRYLSARGRIEFRHNVLAH